ncbi:MAG: tyrosine--tRNA ligase, partial [Candidatus Phytoplasma australasiaticum]|nr:tyrosine--tRNA ligase [Candidatus Phytoplasma australasiaticum]
MFRQNSSISSKSFSYDTVNFYCGFDPTAISLTIGHLVQINTILLLYNKGHTPFILI